jgi:hypothetical protein
MKHVLARLEGQAWNTTGARALQMVAGLVVVYRALSEVRFAPFLFESDASSWASSPILVYVALSFWLVGGVGLLTGVLTRLSSLLALAAYVVLETLTVTHDGGDNVLRIVLLYMVFLHDRLPAPHRIEPGARVLLHNVGVGLIYLQVVTLYFVSGTLKMQGEVWFNGTALYYITGVEAYSTGVQLLRDLFSNPVVVTLGCYSAMVYQVGFPFMLTSRFHLVWVLLGISFHLGIFVVMGLTTFSAIMIGLILFTVRDSEWASLQAFASGLVSRLRQGGPVRPRASRVAPH